jgi:hypothetical protein
LRKKLLKTGRRQRGNVERGITDQRLKLLGPNCEVRGATDLQKNADSPIVNVRMEVSVWVHV